MTSSHSRNTEASETPFRKWFKAQYGRMPNPAKAQKLQAVVDEANYRLARAVLALRDEESIGNAWTDALYGWNARKK